MITRGGFSSPGPLFYRVIRPRVHVCARTRHQAVCSDYCKEQSSKSEWCLAYRARPRACTRVCVGPSVSAAFARCRGAGAFRWLCCWRLSVPVARTAPPPPPHRLFSQNALQFIKQYWKMHGRPLFLVLIREDNIRYVEERGEA